MDKVAIYNLKKKEISWIKTIQIEINSVRYKIYFDNLIKNSDNLIISYLSLIILF